MTTMRSVLSVLVLMNCVLMHSANALIHVVGGSCGWEIPPNPHFYSDWAKPRTFGVNDKLVFPYRIGGHNVIQVPKEDFDKCGHDHIISQEYKGPTVLLLNQTGDYYFYSSIGTHCEMGQKLHITVGTAPGSSGRVFTPPRRLLLGATDMGADEHLSPDLAPALAPGPGGHEEAGSTTSDATSFVSGSRFWGVIASSLVATIILI